MEMEIWHLPHFFSSFSYGRQFKVKVWSILSDVHDHEMGVPQGSTLYVTLFSIKSSSLSKCIAF